MRTTIRIDDALYREVKARAAAGGRTVASVIEDAVRRGLDDDARSARPPFRVRASGRGGVRPGVDLASSAALREALDDGRPVDELR
jgi:hypothetical protein